MSQEHKHVKIQWPVLALETSEVFWEWFGLSVLTEWLDLLKRNTKPFKSMILRILIKCD